MNQDKETTAHLFPMPLDEALEIVKASVGSLPYVTILAVVNRFNRLEAENKRLRQENDRLRQQTKEQIAEILDWPIKQVRRKFDSTAPAPSDTDDSDE